METLQRRSPPAGMTAELEFMAGFRFLSKKMKPHLRLSELPGILLKDIGFRPETLHHVKSLHSNIKHQLVNTCCYILHLLMLTLYAG